MSIHSRSYENLLDFRKQEFSDFFWVSRQLNPKVAYKQDGFKPTPVSHKEAVLKSQKIQTLLERTCMKHNILKEHLEEQIRAILDEIGYNKSWKVIRWFGLFLIKICSRISTGIYVNAGALHELKAEFGYCPVIFVPSHRSYADFILMSLMCFTYDIEIPAIAAGMDFHGMWGMGSMLRDTGAFFMRRSYNDDSLYWTTFKQYVHQLVTKGEKPIEFFIEGTRSRSNKSLLPKYGLISMVLKAYFFAEVYDILFVPININYDRILEESLFAFELLGVPKPRESTSGFFKSMKILKENFGNVYFHFDKPISVRDYFGDRLDRSIHNLKPVYMQELTENEKSLIPPLAHEIIHKQQKNCTITIFNLVSLALNDNLTRRKDLLSLTELAQEVHWLKDLIENFGGYVFAKDIETSIKDCFVIHQNLIEVTKENKVRLVQNSIVLDQIESSKLKAHSLSEKTMTYSVPFVMLQTYVNPTLHFFIDAAVLVTVISCKGNLSKNDLFNNYHFIRSLFSMEFVTFLPREKTAFNAAIEQSQKLELIKLTNDFYELGTNKKLKEFLKTVLEPFIVSYFVACNVLQQIATVSDEKSILASIQKILEERINNNTNFVHPYCLNLDTLNNCLNSLVSLGVLSKNRSNNQVMYEINTDDVTKIKDELGAYIPKCHIEDIFITRVHLQNKL